MRYFELYFPDGYSMIIKALREPTMEEAKAFIEKDMAMLKQTEILDITEWTREDALTAFDFSNENNWPVFGAEEEKV